MNIEPHEETETFDRLFLELSQFTKAKTKRDLQLDELLYAVERKFHGETRFETALRYIREAEAKSAAATSAVTPAEPTEDIDGICSRGLAQLERNAPALTAAMDETPNARNEGRAALSRVPLD